MFMVYIKVLCPYCGSEYIANCVYVDLLTIDKKAIETVKIG